MQCRRARLAKGWSRKVPESDRTRRRWQAQWQARPFLLRARGLTTSSLIYRNHCNRRGGFRLPLRNVQKLGAGGHAERGSKLSKPYELPYWSPRRQLGSPQSASQRWKRPPSGGAMLQDFKKILVNTGGLSWIKMGRSRPESYVRSGKALFPVGGSPTRQLSLRPDLAEHG